MEDEIKAFLHLRDLAFQLFADDIPVVGVQGPDVDAAHKGNLIAIQPVEL